MPKGYIYVEIEVTDPENYKLHYMSRSTPAVAAYGGRFLSRGGNVDVKIGEDDGCCRVVVEFDSYQQARDFYHSPAYQEAITHRDRYSKVYRYLILEGVDY